MMWKMRLFGTTNLLQLQEGQFSIGCGNEPGVKYTKHLMIEHGNLMALNVFQHTLGIKTHFLQYLGLANTNKKEFWEAHLNGKA